MSDKLSKEEKSDIDKNIELPADSPKKKATTDVMEKAPKSYFIPSILATIFCCPPIGIFGIIKAARVERLFSQGEHEAAQAASDAAKKWILRTIVAWAIITVGYLLIAAFFLKEDLPY